MKYLKPLTLFNVGGSLYIVIEILFRGYSHWTMFLLGGLCFCMIGLINEKCFTFLMPMWKQSIIGALIITVLEFFTGCVINLILKWNIWDYSNLPLNLWGQISLIFSLLWVPISIIAIFLDDYLRYLFFKEEKPYYKWF